MKVAKEKRTGGFTLIELIVVIAILGILAGVGTVAYTGYIKAANKGVDKQTVGDLMYAAQLADYANPSLFGENGNAVIVVTNNGTSVFKEKYSAAIEDAMGNLASVSLTYDSWNGKLNGSLMQSALTKLTEYQKIAQNGYTASYANNIDALWEDVEAYAKFYETANQNAEGENKKNAAEFLAKAASVSAATSNGVTTWASGNTLIQGNEDGNQTASYAQSMARNYSLAAYVANNSSKYGVSSDGLETLKTVQGASMDYFSLLYGYSKEGTSGEVDKRAENYFSQEDVEILQKAAKDYIASDSQGCSQAQADAEAFYALMATIDEASQVDENGNVIHSTADSESYMASMRSYANMVGTVLDNQLEDTDINGAAQAISNSETSVVIIATKVNGVLNFVVSPEEADPREDSENDSENETEKPAITFSNTTVTTAVGKSNSTTCIPSNFTRAINCTAGTSDSAVATVRVNGTDANGNPQIQVTGVSAGTATITVTATDGTNTVTGTFEVSVVGASTPNITMSEATKNAEGKYESCIGLSVSGNAVVISGTNDTVKIYDGTTQVRRSMIAGDYSAVSADESVAKANFAAAGVQIEAVGTGTTTVTVTVCGQTVTISVTVI